MSNVPQPEPADTEPDDERDILEEIDQQLDTEDGDTEDQDQAG